MRREEEDNEIKTCTRENAAVLSFVVLSELSN